MSHVQDRWYTKIPDENDPTQMVRVPTARHGKGKRYKARFIGPDGVGEVSRSFPNGQFKLAQDWLTRQQVDLALGEFVDPRSGKVKVEPYARRWLRDLDINEASREIMEMRFTKRILPHFGHLEFSQINPSVVRSWDRKLRAAKLSDRYRHTLHTNLGALFTAAQEDSLIAKSPFAGKSIKKPRPSKRKVVPWSEEQVWGVQSGLPGRFRILIDEGAGLGLRQGECFGLALEDVDFLRNVVHVRRQVKTVRNKRVFALPKYDKTREIPLSEPVKLALAAHIKRYPPRKIALPWDTPDGRLVTVQLITTSMWGKAIAANDFNRNYWKLALQGAGLSYGRYQNGMHELRHFFASVLLDQGESIKAVAEWLGHTDEAFTLATYAHLMPASTARTRTVIAGVYQRQKERAQEVPDGPETAQRGRQEA